MKAFRGNKLLLLSIPLFAAMVIIVSFLARESRPDPAAGSGSRAGSTSKTPDPGSAMEDLRRMRQRSPGAAQENSAELRAARQSLVELEEAAIPRIQNGIRSSSESELFRFELISVLADMKSPRAESALVEVFTGGSLEEKYRALALVKLTGRSSDEIFRAFQEVLERERNFGGRHLVVKALGLIKREEVTTILIGSAERDPSPSARIQAVESL